MSNKRGATVAGIVTSGSLDEVQVKKTRITQPDNSASNILILPPGDGTLATYPSGGGTFVDTTSSQTINGFKKLDGTTRVKELLIVKAGSGDPNNEVTSLIGDAVTPINLLLPASSGTLAKLSDIPSSANFVTLTGSQTITGSKKFNGGFVMGEAGTFNIVRSGGDPANDYTSILATALGTPSYVNLPSTDGDLALVQNTVSLATTQTVSGTKSFTGGTGIATSGTYPRTSASNQQSSTFTTPAIQVGGSTNDGLYSSVTDVIDFGSQGTNYVSLQPQGIYRFVGGTVDPAIVFNQRIQVFNGANGATSPAIQIDNQNSGFYRVNQGTIGIGISGVATARWSSTGLNLFGVSGDATNAAICLGNDTNTGLFSPGADQLAVTTGGTQRTSWSTTEFNVNTGCKLQDGTASTTSTGTQGFLRQPIGTATALTGANNYYWSTFTQPGTTGGTTGSIATVRVTGAPTNSGDDNTNTDAIRCDSGSIRTVTGNIIAGSGTLSNPALRMTDTGSGLYRPAANQVAVACAGVQRGLWSSTGLTVTGALSVVGGVATSASGGVSMQKNTTQSAPTGATTTVVNYTTSSTTGGSLFSANTTTGIITMTVTDAPFLLMLTGHISWPSGGTTGMRELIILDTTSGIRFADAQRNYSADAGDTTKLECSQARMITSNQTYTLAMQVYHNGGGTPNVGNQTNCPVTTFSAFRVF